MGVCHFLHSWPSPIQSLAGSLRMVTSYNLPACVLMLVARKESRDGSESQNQPLALATRARLAPAAKQGTYWAMHSPSALSPPLYTM